MTTHVHNRKARFHYDFLEEFEAGVQLFGHEVKAIKAGQASLNGAYVIIRGAEAFLVGATISPYQAANTPDSYDPERPRKLLLHRKELDKLDRESVQSRLTVVPIKWYSKDGKVKLSVVLARGKKKADKREALKERDTKRDIQRILKNQ